MPHRSGRHTGPPQRAAHHLALQEPSCQPERWLILSRGSLSSDFRLWLRLGVFESWGDELVDELRAVVDECEPLGVVQVASRGDVLVDGWRPLEDDAPVGPSLGQVLLGDASLVA